VPPGAMREDDACLNFVNLFLGDTAMCTVCGSSENNYKGLARRHREIFHQLTVCVNRNSLFNFCNCVNYLDQSSEFTLLAKTSAVP